jgi:tetratricopeptide (TPR) repeat protein
MNPGKSSMIRSALAAPLAFFFCAQSATAEDQLQLLSTPAPSRSTNTTSNNARGLRQSPFILEAEGRPDRPADIGGELDLEQAILLLQDKEYTEAIPLLEDALKRMPTVEAIWEALGWAYYGAGRTQDTEILWRQYATLRPDSPKAHSLLAQLAILRSDWHAADQHLSEGLRLEPQNFDIRFWYAQNLLRLGRLEQSLAIFQTLVTEDDLRYDVKIDLARVFTLVQEYEKSLDLWEEIVDAFPDNVDFRTEYARILMLTGGLEEADEQARMILEKDPAQIPIVMLRSDVAELSNIPDSIVRSLTELIEQTEDEETRAHIRVRLAARYVILHRKHAKLWPIELALAQYQAAIETVPHDVSWLNQYAAIALLARQPREAERIINRILKEINPYNQEALRSRFELAMLERNYDLAELALDDYYDRFAPNNPYRHFDHARIAVQRGSFFRALDELEKFEEAGHKGAILTLLYHGLTESEWMAVTSTRRLQEQLMALQSAGYTFIPVSDIPAYMKGDRGIAAFRTLPPPWLARQVDNIRYAFTGNRKIENISALPPQKVAVVTFDDGERSSFRLGTPIAEDLQIPFWMAVITHIEELNAPIYAAWEEIRQYFQTGAWEIGSHTMRNNTDRPAGPPPAPPAAPLPNRVWLPERNRLETIREWTRRVRHEFEESRRLIEKHLELEPGQFMAVAYPYSNIGQATGSNVARLLNPIRTILNEASRVHTLGFIVDEMGYTTPDDNLLMIRRYEPAWDAEAEDVLEHALTTHPVMMARRMRAEIAVLSDRPYLAKQQIGLLRRDGYPDKKLRELQAFAENRSIMRLDSASLHDPENRKPVFLKPSNLYIAGSYHENQSNEEIRQRYGQARAGLNLNPRVGIEGTFRKGTIDQTVTTNIWFTVPRTDFSSSSETRTETINGVTTVSSVQVRTANTRNAQTNRTERYAYSADIEELRAALTLRVSDDAYVGVTFGEKRLDFAPGRGRQPGTESATVMSLSASWRPYYALTISASYNQDLVPSARQKIYYDALAVGIFWKLRDSWELNTSTRYASYRDKNALLSVSGSSVWELIQRQGIWGGIEGAIYTMDDESDLYWTPYWDTRYAGLLRLRRRYPLYMFEVDLRIGQQREKGRPAAINEYRNLKAQAAADGTWDAGSGPGSPLTTFVGVSGSWRQRIWHHWDLFMNANINFLKDYSEHDVAVGVQLNFE